MVRKQVQPSHSCARSPLLAMPFHTRALMHGNAQQHTGRGKSRERGICAFACEGDAIEPYTSEQGTHKMGSSHQCPQSIIRRFKHSNGKREGEAMRKNALTSTQVCRGIVSAAAQSRLPGVEGRGGRARRCVVILVPAPFLRRANEE